MERYLILPTSSSDLIINSGVVKLDPEDSELDNVCFWKVCDAILKNNNEHKLSSIVNKLRSYRELSNQSSGFGSNFVISQRYDDMDELEFSYSKTCVQTLDFDDELLNSVRAITLLLPDLFPDQQVLLCSQEN